MNLHGLLPEMIMLAAAAVILLNGLCPRESVRRASQWLALVGLVAAFVAAWRLAAPGQNAGWPLWPLATFGSLLASGVGLLAVLASWNMPFKDQPGETDSAYRGEYFALLLCSLAGLSMMAKVNNLIWLFLALELVSIPTYIMVAAGRGHSAAQEAGVKYFFLGALSAAVYLFGFSYLYGFAGSTRFSAIAAAFHSALAPGHPPAIALIGLLMVVLGISYKIAAVPLHYYAPDVYQGAATPVTAFLAFTPKAAGFIALILVFNLTGWQLSSSLAGAVPALLMALAVVTMFVGNVLALLQRNLKRILAYSSIAHSGYMLAALALGPALSAEATRPGELGDSSINGLSALLFYLAAYSLMTLGAFAVLIYLEGQTGAAEDFDGIAGLAGEHPLAAGCMAVCLFSLIGMPGTVGFLGKLFIVQAVLAAHHPVLAVLIVINAAIAATYYLRIVAAMYLRAAATPLTVRRPALALKLAAAVATFLVIFFGLFPGALYRQSVAGGRSVPTAYSAARRPGRSALRTAVGTPGSGQARAGLRAG